MRHWRIGTGILFVLFAVTTQARAGGGFGASGGSATPSGGTGSPGIGGGMIGMGGGCGHNGIFGMGGCYGSVGLCGFGGCMGGNPYCFGSFSGCCGGFPQPTQSYSKWAPSPTKAYYHRTLTIQTPPPNESALEFVLVHYPDRPKLFFYFDPVDKKYFGRYRMGATPTDCFQVLSFPDRKASLKDIKESSWRGTGGMATLQYVIQPRAAAPLDAYLKNLKLLRPPESIPDDLLGLPAEEPALKKAPEKK